MGRRTSTHGPTRPARHRPGVVTALVCGLVAAGGLLPAVAADGAAATVTPDGAWDDSRSFDESGVVATSGSSGASGASTTGADGGADDVVVATGRAVVGEWGDAATADQRSAGFSIDALPTATLYLAVDVASPGSTSGYRARVRVEPDGRLVVGTSTVEDGREGDYRSTTTDFLVEAGDVVNLEGDFHHAADGLVRVRAWPADRTRPDWQHRTVDEGTAPVGAVLADRSWTYLSGSAKEPAHVGVGDLVGKGTTPVTTPAPPPPVVPPPPPVVPTPPAPVVPTPPRPSGRPDAASTGVPDGTRLTRHDGDLVITTPGARYDALDVHGFVVVRAPDVTITRSLIRGGDKDGNRGLVTVDHADAKRFVIEDSTIRPDKASVWYDGIKGSGFTARRVDVWGTVDNIKVHGDDVLVEDSWLHDSRWYAWDPNQRGPSHNDGVQVLGGSRITLRGNSITGASNGAVQVTQDFREVRGLDISGNWFDGGTCSVKVSHKGRDSGPQVQLRDNRFGILQSILGCSSLATHRTDLQASGNVWDLTGLPAPVRRWG